MLEVIARRSFVHLARTLRPGEIKAAQQCEGQAAS